MMAIPTLHPGKAVVQVATIQVAVNDLLEVGSPEPVRLFEPLLVDLNKGLKMVLHAPVIIRRLRVPGTINGGRSGHDSSPPRKSRRHLYSSFDELSRKILRAKKRKGNGERNVRKIMWRFKIKGIKF
jgi:hypothetical protein